MHEIDQMLKLQLEGNHEEARKLSDKLEAIGPEKILDGKGVNTEDIWFRHCFNRGWFMIQQGDYQQGSQLLEHGRFLNVYGSGPLKTDAPIYNPQEHDIKGKSLIITLEGGYGDEIIHARFAKSFKKLGADKVYLAAAPELVSVFERMEGVDGVILRNQAHTVEHDFWVPGFSAGWVAGHTFDDFPGDPYLTPKSESVEIWKNLIKADEGQIKVGIRWAGNPKFEHQQFRRFPENFITNLSKYPELKIFSLQRDHNVIQLPDNITDLQYFLLSWEDTMAAIANLDIVITSCTSIAHLSAAMGKETWVIVPILPYHTWTYGSPDNNTSPYYKCVKLFRQKKARVWNETFQDLYTQLEQKFNLTHIDMPNEDKESKKLNLGSGLKKFDGFLNVDMNPLTKPDQVVDLNVFPWPWETDEFDHIVAKDILEHLGDKPSDMTKIVKEMYRISRNGAIWEVQTPHWNCDTSINDPTHVRRITPTTFNLFNKQFVLNKAQQGESDSLLAFEHDVDIEVCDMNFEYTAPFDKRVKEKSISEEELDYALNHLNNVAQSTRILIQVHKPGRIDIHELNRVIDGKTS
jgi:hypothetical protein